MNNRVGQQFGNYRLLAFLGKGGFAEVYLGEHIHLQRQAAIKVVSTPLLQADQQSYLQEARVQVALKHPHILHLLDCGIEQGLPFLVMDYAPHGTLRQRHLRGVRVPLQQVIKYLSYIAPALQYAHDQNLIHRDLKPENILIGQNGEILLSDFGIAIISSTSKPQVAYNVAGTAMYMAPEQIMGHPVYASDQYALGVVVYEWLAGTSPFQGSFQEITAQHLHASPPPLHQKGVSLQPGVEHIVMKALEKDPVKRFASVQEFALTLTNYSQIIPQSTTHSSTSSRVVPSPSIIVSPPSPSAQMTSYPGMITSPVFPSTQPAPAHSSPIPSNPPLSRISPTFPPTQPAPTHSSPIPSNSLPSRASSPRRRFLLTVGFIGATALGCGALSFLGILRGLTPTPHPPTSIPHSLKSIPHPPTSIPDSLTPTPDSLTPTPHPLTPLRIYIGGHTSPVSSVAWSPDGKMLASGDLVGKINIWSVEPSGDKPVNSYPYQISSSVNVITWSPDGQSIAAGYNDNTIQIWSQGPGINYSHHQGPIYSLAWSSQSGLIASVSSESNDIHIWDATTGSLLNAPPLASLLNPNASPLKVSSLAWSHKSTPLYLAINANEDSPSHPQVFLWEQNEKRFLSEKPFKLDAPITVVAWNENDSQLLVATGLEIFSNNEKKVSTLSPGATGSEQFHYSQHDKCSADIQAICWKAEVIYAACSDGNLYIEDRNTFTSRIYQTSPSGVTQNQNARAWSPDGKYLAYGLQNGRVVLWQVPSK